MNEWGSADAARVVAGTRIAGYLLDQEVGQGATGAVFRARDERGQPVALKIIGPPLAADPEFAGRLMREARAAAAVGDPHILPALQVAEADGKLFVSMPFINGVDARSLVRREGTLPPQRVTAIVWPVASALDAAHASGLVHGDVKPTNVLVESRPGQPDLVYLSDFGQGRPTASAQAGAALDCIAPEQAEGKQADGRADQYALACVAFELLTGVPLHHGEPAALLRPRPDPPKASSLRPGLPSAVDVVLSRALAQFAVYRYPTCRDFADALHDALPGDSVSGQPTAVTIADSGLAVPDPGPAAAAGFEVPAAAAAVGGLFLTGPAASSPIPAVPFPGGAGAAGVFPGSPGDPADPGVGPPGVAPAGAGFHPGASAGARAPGQGMPGGEPWITHSQQQRFRILPFALALVAVVIVAGLVAGLVVALRGGRATPKLAALHIAATSGTKPEGGYVWTIYSQGHLARAQIRGDITGAASGEVARLYAQQFPFTSAPARVGSAVGLRPSAAGTASYSFSVTPGLATRYHVELFKTKSAKTALTRTATTTVYVAVGFFATSGIAPCQRPVCKETITGDVAVPASTIDAEIAKQVYVYFGVDLVNSVTAPKPKVLQLYAGGATVKVKLVSPTVYQITVGFKFTIGTTGGYNWDWDVCTKDTEAQDGIGLPGSHRCGDNTIPSHANYIG